MAELFPVVGIARNEAFVHTVGPEGTPFVVVAAQPQLSNGGKTVVRGDELRVKMAMIVDDGQAGSLLVIERPRRVVVQQEVGMDEGCLHDGKHVFLEKNQRENTLNPPSTTATVPVTKAEASEMR